MIIHWAIRYLDRSDRQFKDRGLNLDTTTLPLARKIAIELAIETNADRDFLKFRSLFQHDNVPDVPEHRLVEGAKIFSLEDYFEDENGIELSGNEIAAILSGSNTALLIPRGAEQHDIDYLVSMQADPQPLVIPSATLSEVELKTLGYFTRDLRELLDSAFLKEPSPARIKGTGSGPFSPASEPVLETAVSYDEIGSFVMTYRRLNLEEDRGNFLKAVKVFKRRAGDHPVVNWVAGTAKSHTKSLNQPPWICPFVGREVISFTRRRLFEAVIYTQFAHQPNDNRQREFRECLQEVKGMESVLMWLFLTEIRHSALKIGSAGKQIAQWFTQYCDQHQVTPDILKSILAKNPGIGSQEKAMTKRARVFREKTEKLAGEMWRENGCPAGGPAHFFDRAQDELRKLMEQGTHDR